MSSVESEYTISVVVVEKVAQTDDVHEIGFGKGERLASESSEALTQREVKPLDMIGLALILAAGSVLLGWHDFEVSLPEVAIDQTTPIVGWDLLPQASAG